MIRRPPAVEGGRGTLARLRLRMDRRDDRGVTLVELLVASVLMVTVGGLVSLSLDTFLNVSNQVHTSYANTQQILPDSTNVQRLIRSEVEPGPTPTSTNIPVPPFVPGAESTMSMTFYANVGVPGTPARVVASLNGTTFTVTDQLADPGTCPTSFGSTAVCTFLDNPAKRVASITNIVNTPSQPIFTYTLLDSAGNQTIVPSSAVATTFGSCVAGAPEVTNCPGDAVQGVEVNLFIDSPGSKSLAPAEDNTTVYRLSTTSYLYDPTVG